MMTDSFSVKSSLKAMQQHRKSISSAAVMVRRIITLISVERLQKRCLF